MMKFKKFLAAAMTGAMMLGVVATAAPAVAVYADEGDGEGTTDPGTGEGGEDEKPPVVSASPVTINYNNYTAEITLSEDDTYAFIEVWKMDKEGKFSKVANTYSYELTSGKATADLSFLKATAVQGIKVYGDVSTTPVEVIIAKQPEKLSLKYVAADTLAKSFTGKIGKTAIPETGLTVADYQYKGQYGADWLDLADFEQINHTSAGSTIIVRAKATKDAPAGPEAKVKIAAAAKAPKAKVDYVKGTVTFPKKTEYYDAATKKFVAIADADLKTTVDKLREQFKNDGTAELVILVRTAADTEKKKAASNVTPVILPASAVADSSKEGVVTVSDSKATVTYKETEGKKKDTTVYEFTAAGASFDFSIDGGKTWKTVKDKGVYSVTMTSEVQTVLVRMTGVKEASLASTSAEVKVPAKSATGGDKTGTVESVTVTAADGATSVVKGGTLKFSATVKASEGVAQTVKWEVKDGASGTSIDADGLLTVASDETATSLTVTATSTADDKKSASVTVTVAEE